MEEITLRIKVKKVDGEDVENYDLGTELAAELDGHEFEATGEDAEAVSVYVIESAEVV